MSKHETIKGLSKEQFKRLVGVQKETFAVMIEVLKEAMSKRYRQAGRKSKLSLEDRLLMALEYLREYRTYFHLGASYGLSESTSYKTCRWIEDELIKSGKFSLPGKKVLVKEGGAYELILIDATETPVE